MKQPPRIEQKVFEALRWHMQGRIDDFHRFASTRYSFEEWFNWEAFSACDRVPGWTARPRPLYRTLGVPSSRDFGDLLVETGGERALVEVAIVHSATGNKWFEKIAHDTAKLQRLPDPLGRLQIVGVFSAKNPLTHASWTRWLDRVAIWSDRDRLLGKARLDDEHRASLGGWAIEAGSTG